MASPYSHKHFFRKIPPSQLASYFASKGIDLGIDFSTFTIKQVYSRKTLVTLGQTRCQTPEDFKAWSQNLGHEDVLTTLYSYGHVQEQRQGHILKLLKSPRAVWMNKFDVFS